jgi:hypothetical protein
MHHFDIEAGATVPISKKKKIIGETAGGVRLVADMHRRKAEMARLSRRLHSTA